MRCAQGLCGGRCFCQINALLDELLRLQALGQPFDLPVPGLEGLIIL